MEKTTTSNPANQELFNSFIDLHAQASGALSRIRGVARCALRSLEAESGARDLESIAEALTAIALEADMSHNDVDVSGQKHGLETMDRAWSNRMAAMYAAQKINSPDARHDSARHP